MSIVTRIPFVVKPRRPFGVGLVDPEPAQPRRVSFSAGVEPAGSSWRSEVLSLFRALGYDSAVARAEAFTFIEAHRTATGCPLVDEDDQPVVNAILARHGVTPTAPEPELPPAPRRGEPSEEDRSWWAAETERAAWRNAHADRNAAIPWTCTPHELGMIPPDAAAEIMSTSLVGHPA